MGIFETRKLTFAFINSFLFLIIASPIAYRMMAPFFDLTYEGETDNNRTSLLFIHAFLFSIITLILVNVYSPVITY